MADGDVQRGRRCILLQMNMEITSDSVIDLYLFVFFYICIYCIYVFSVCSVTEGHVVD